MIALKMTAHSVHVPITFSLRLLFVRQRGPITKDSDKCASLLPFPLCHTRMHFLAWWQFYVPGRGPDAGGGHNPYWTITNTVFRVCLRFFCDSVSVRCNWNSAGGKQIPMHFPIANIRNYFNRNGICRRGTCYSCEAPVNLCIHIL